MSPKLVALPINIEGSEIRSLLRQCRPKYTGITINENSIKVSEKEVFPMISRAGKPVVFILGDIWTSRADTRALKTVHTLGYVCRGFPSRQNNAVTPFQSFYEPLTSYSHIHTQHNAVTRGFDISKLRVHGSAELRGWLTDFPRKRAPTGC